MTTSATLIHRSKELIANLNEIQRLKLKKCKAEIKKDIQLDLCLYDLNTSSLEYIKWLNENGAEKLIQFVINTDNFSSEDEEKLEKLLLRNGEMGKNS